ncbi:MAG: PDZ domain-containing protein [Chloroflexi bacterium]|nr:PDZ domain-containing protein [Chloroflexota bacterium]
MTRLLTGERRAASDAPSSIRFVILALAVLITGATVGAGCATDDADPPIPAAAVSPSPSTAEPTQPRPAAGSVPGTPSPESLDAALRALIGSMTGGGIDPFAGPPGSLPPELRTLLHALGIDLRLGAAVREIRGGVAIQAVFAGSPAERAGLVVGDVVTGFDGRILGGSFELHAAVAAAPPGETYTLTVHRAGVTHLVAVEHPLPEDAFWRSDMLRTLALGLMLANRPGGLALPPSLLGELLEETPDGLRVFAVFPGSPADFAGLRAGDYVLAIEGSPMRTLDDLNALMLNFNPIAAETAVTLLRDGEEMTVRVAFRIGGLFGAGAPPPAE